jgi:hypothetical protein
MSVNEKDFSGFDKLSLDEKLNLIYRLLCHIETEQDRIKTQVGTDHLRK